MKKILGIIIGLIVLAGAGAGGYFFVLPLFSEPGEVIFAGNALPEAERTAIQEAVAKNNLALRKDVTISVAEKTARADGLLYNIRVPVTDFYDPTTSVSAEVAKTKLIPFAELDNKVKLLAIDDQYFLDDLAHGAYFDYLVLEGDKNDIAKLTPAIQAVLTKFPEKSDVLSLAQTGVTALSRGMNNKLLQVKDAKYFAENIKDFLAQFDFAHTSNEASFSAGASSQKGTMVICALPNMIDAITASHFNIIELTGNHNQDCGDAAALETLETYANLGIKTYGGGATAEKAAEALEIKEKGTGLTMLGYNLSTGGYTLDATPGANFYVEERVQNDIATAKARGDVVIVDVQYYECSNYVDEAENIACDYANSSAGDQIGLFRHLIDLGADVVVGTSAHQSQTYELYGNGAIYYGLGNLYFDQVWWPGTTRSLVLAHYFADGKLLQTKIVPTVFGDEMQPRVMDTADAEKFIARLNNVRPAQ